MSRRIDVELTSRRDDGTWTWRAAGAKQPKGVLDGALLPQGATAGDVLRVDADFDVDGIFVTQVLPPKARSGRPPSERIELLGTRERDVAPSDGAGASGRRDRKRNTDDKQKRSRRSERDTRAKKRKRDDGRGDRDSDSEAEQNAAQRESEKSSGRRKRKDTQSADSRPRSRNTADSSPRDSTKDGASSRPKARKLRPGRKHRDALIASLPDEHKIVAEQLARGGLAAVRDGIAEQNRKAAADGAPEVPAEGLVALAESLVTKVQIAEWRDRADAAIAGLERVDLRELRSVLVAAEDFARDAQTREQADKIREGLDQRLERSQNEWHEELRATLSQERVVRALRLSSRPPKAGAPLPPDIAERLTEQANAALGTGNSQHRIAVVLDAVAFSPIRPYIVLPSVPGEPTEELLEVVRKVANRLPEIAGAFGIDPSPPKRRNQDRRRNRPTDADAAEGPDAGADTDASADADSSANADTPGHEPDGEAKGDEIAAEGSVDEVSVDDVSVEGDVVESAAQDVLVEELAHPS